MFRWAPGELPLRVKTPPGFDHSITSLAIYYTLPVSRQIVSAPTIAQNIYLSIGEGYLVNLNLPHPLNPPLLQRRGGYNFKREAKPPFDLP